MKVSNNNNVSFGYNKALDKRLTEQLKVNKTFPKESLRSIRKLRDNVNETETNIREALRRKDFLTAGDLIPQFLTLKSSLAAIVNQKFPYLNYLNIELRDYNNELQKKYMPEHPEKTDWIASTVELLQDIMQEAGVVQELESEVEVPAIENENLEQDEQAKVSVYNFDALGGMGDIKEILNDKIISVYNNPEEYFANIKEYGTTLPSGVIFHGPDGCGKRSVFSATANEIGIPKVIIDARSFSSDDEKAVQDLISNTFADYKQRFQGQPYFVLFANAESLFSPAETITGASIPRDGIVSRFLYEKNAAESEGALVFLSTNDIESLDPNIVNNFEEQISFSYPKEKDRVEMLKLMLKDREKGIALSEDSESLKKLAEATEGFTQKDLEATVKSAGLAALKDGRRDIKYEDFKNVLENYEFSAFIERYKPTEKTKQGFASLAGMHELKELMNKKVVSILKNPEQAKIDKEDYGKDLPEGVLLYGPPKCGKSTFVEHMASEAGVPLYKLNANLIETAESVDEVLMNIDNAFDALEFSFDGKPGIAMINNASSLLAPKYNYTNGLSYTDISDKLMKRIKEAKERSVVVVIVNDKISEVDKVIANNIKESVYVGLPNKEDRKEILLSALKPMAKGKELSQNSESVAQIVDMTEGYSVSDIRKIVEDASMLALDSGRKNISVSNFEEVISKNKYTKIKEKEYLPEIESNLGFRMENKK